MPSISFTGILAVIMWVSYMYLGDSDFLVLSCTAFILDKLRGDKQ